MLSESRHLYSFAHVKTDAPKLNLRKASLFISKTFSVNKILIIKPRERFVSTAKYHYLFRYLFIIKDT